MYKPSRIVLLALVGSCALPALTTAAPLGIPVPTTVTISDLTATTAYGGDVQGTMPGVDACASAPHQAISLPADEAPHNSETYIEFWWWTAHLAAPDGRQLGVMLYFPSKPWADYYAAEYAITDISNGTFHYGRDPMIVGQPRPRTSDVPHKRARCARPRVGRFRSGGRALSAVRDRLRASSKDHAAYELLKRDLARRTWLDMNDYADAKGALISESLDRART